MSHQYTYPTVKPVPRPAGTSAPAPPAPPAEGPRPARRKPDEDGPPGRIRPKT